MLHVKEGDSNLVLMVLSKLATLKLSEATVQYIREDINKIDPKDLIGKNRNVVVEKLVGHYLASIQRHYAAAQKKTIVDNTPDNIYGAKDYQTYSNNVLRDDNFIDPDIDTANPNAASLDGIKSSVYNTDLYNALSTIQLPNMPNYKHYYLALDRRNIFNYSNNTYTWLMQTNNSSLGVINLQENIENIKIIKMHPFLLPSDSTVVVGNVLSVAVELVTFNQQSYIKSDNSKYHFMFQMTKGTDLNNKYQYECIELNSNVQEFIFDQPIQNTTQIGIRLSTPDGYLTLDEYDLTGNISTYTCNSIITFTVPHNLELGDIITIQNFATDDPLLDGTTINNANRATGFIVTEIISSTSIKIALDLSSVVPIPLITVIVPSKIFVFHIEVITV